MGCRCQKAIPRSRRDHTPQELPTGETVAGQTAPSLSARGRRRPPDLSEECRKSSPNRAPRCQGFPWGPRRLTEVGLKVNRQKETFRARRPRNDQAHEPLGSQTWPGIQEAPPDAGFPRGGKASWCSHTVSSWGANEISPVDSRCLNKSGGAARTQRVLHAAVVTWGDPSSLSPIPVTVAGLPEGEPLSADWESRIALRRLPKFDRTSIKASLESMTELTARL